LRFEVQSVRVSLRVVYGATIQVAVIFHDFHVLVSVAKRSSSNLTALNNDPNSDYHELANGMHECENYFEHNAYIDVILSDVLTYAGDRRIVFSSFDPDVCAIIAAKQHLYPVLFLCVGMTTRYEPFVDMRASTSNAAVNFAASINILVSSFIVYRNATSFLETFKACDES
uniref:GP-PDE domain-containing protein n=1 Tax=Parascaris equorum TaxID=6256 RepID=A0A914RMB6_PAREQ